MPVGPAQPQMEPAGTLHLPEDPPGSTTQAKHLPDNASGVSTLSIACKVWAKSSKEDQHLKCKKNPSYITESKLLDPTMNMLWMPAGVILEIR